MSLTSYRTAPPRGGDVCGDLMGPMVGREFWIVLLVWPCWAFMERPRLEGVCVRKKGINAYRVLIWVSLIWGVLEDLATIDSPTS